MRLQAFAKPETGQREKLEAQLLRKAIKACVPNITVTTTPMGCHYVFDLCSLLCKLFVFYLYSMGKQPR